MKNRAKLLCVVGLALAGFLFRGALFQPHVVNSPAGPGAIVILGDSLTEGIGASAGHTYPEQLAGLVSREVIARGVAGETSAQGLARLQRDVLDLKPPVIMVLLGGNDILQRVPPEKTIANIDSIIGQATATGALVVLATVEPPLGMGSELRKGLKAIARNHECLFIPDVMDGMIGDSDLMHDAIHPNDAGYAIMAERIAAALRPHL